MAPEGYLAAQNLFTLVAALVVLIGGFAWYMRKRRNRHPMDNARGREIDAQRTRDVLEARADDTPQPRFKSN